MNTTTNGAQMQSVIEENQNSSAGTSSTANTYTAKRAERRRRDQAAAKAAKKVIKQSKKPSKNDLSAEQLAAIQESMESLKAGMVGNTWKTLEVGKTFKQNQKIALITDQTLIVGVDVASEKHDMRAFTNRGIEVSRKALEFANSREGFEKALDWMLELMALNKKTQVVMGLEATGHYWFNLYAWMRDHGITVVLVNPFAVNRIKEVDDNQQLKTDEKDPKTIAGLVKDGRYSIPYLPEGDYAELRGYALLRDIAIDRIVETKNRLHRWTKIYFPAYDSLYDNIDAEGGLLLLEKGLVPEDLVKMGAEGINRIWREAKLRGAGMKRAQKIYEAAKNEIHYGEGMESARVEVRWIAEDLRREQARQEEAEAKMEEFCRKVAKTDNIEAIQGITIKTLAPLLADLGDLSRFESDEEIAKLSGLCPVICSSGKSKGQGKISRRGRKRIRKNLYKMGMSVIAHADEFKELHTYYTTRAKNPLKKMQSLIVVMRKLLRIIRKLILTGEAYDAGKMMSQIRRQTEGGIDLSICLGLMYFPFLIVLRVSMEKVPG